MTTLRVPLERLPSSPVERHAALREYFCDKDAEARADGSMWNLTLTWPEDGERHVDPRLDEGLAWWGQGVTRRTMVTARRRRGRVLSALYDTWTLHSWSEWQAARHDSADDILVLHVDDHRDLGAPRLFMDAGVWRDPIANVPWTLNEPSGVEAAIESGALGMGSFLTPFLHRFPHAEVRHLCQPPKATVTRDFRIVRTTLADNLLDPGAPRPAIDLESATRGTTGLGCYRLTPDVGAWLDMVGSGPALLHIDMDYFNNRFDGDSDWRNRPKPFDPPLDEVLAKIDEMAEALRRTGVGARLEDVVIAYSPGFFPAELWSAAEARLRPALEQLYES